jgi:hypothetical protein
MDERSGQMTRARRVLLAGALGLLVMGGAPFTAIAADASPPPDATPQASADATPDPTPDPTTDPTPDPTPAPVQQPAAEATSEPSPTPGPSPTASPPPSASPTPSPDPTPTPNPSPTPTPPPPSPTATIRALNLYRYSAMVRQYTDYWCVPAATQSMVNLVRGTSNKRYLTQKYYYKLTRQHNRYTYITKGNDPQGWAWSLRYFSQSQANYQWRAYTNKTTAIDSIAEAIQRTRHPVGVTVRGGTHAWVVLGYRVSENLDDPTQRTLLGLYVSGPLGTAADRWPYKYLTVSQFRDVFTRYHEWQRSVVWEGKWVVISE